jgi:hypothetical protein
MAAAGAVAQRRERSDALHARVRAFIRAAEGSVVTEPFDGLACDLARFQAEAIAGVGRLWTARKTSPSEAARAEDLVAVPTSAFKLSRVAAHPEAEDVRVFRTSGTTSGARGEHAFRTLETYDLVALVHGRSMLMPGIARVLPIVLMPPPEEAPESSLGYMCALFSRHFGDGGSFHVRGGAIDAAGVRSRVQTAVDAGLPVLLLTTSFALVHLLDGLGGQRLPLPPGSRVMHTGGFKGRSREVSPAALREQAATALGLDEAAIVSEYGMTELSSQAYDGTLRARTHGGEAVSGVQIAPPWMRIVPVDPVSLEPVPDGEGGIARIVDLANVDSAVAVQTEDRIRIVEGGFEVLGRLPGAPPRGCSLAVEELLGHSP